MNRLSKNKIYVHCWEHSLVLGNGKHADPCSTLAKSLLELTLLVTWKTGLLRVMGIFKQNVFCFCYSFECNVRGEKIIVNY